MVSVKQTSDRGYVFLATADTAITSMGGKAPLNNFAGGAADWLVIKVDAQGNLEWYTFIGSAANDYPAELAASSDGGVVVTGYGGAAPVFSGSPSPNIGSFAGAGAMFVVKLNANGTLGWYDILSGTGDTQGRGIDQAADGGYIIAGITNSSLTLCSTANGSYQTSGYDAVAIKLTSGGAMQWCTYLGAASVNEYGKSVKQAADGGYFLGADASGTSGSPIIAFQGVQDMLLYKLNSSGVMVWQTFIGSPATDSVGRLYASQDSGLLIAGTFGNTIATLGSFSYTGNYGGGNDAVIVKLNGAGQLQWFKLYGGSGNDVASDIVEQSDGSLTASVTAATNIATLYGVSPQRGHTQGDDMVILRTDAAGAPSWYTFYGSSGADQVGAIAKAYDGGFIFAGTAAAAVSGMGTLSPVNAYSAANDIFLLKLRADGSF